MEKFTIFVVQNDMSGTTWIGCVEAADIGDAKSAGLHQCSIDWGCGIENICVLGVAAGDVEILEWEDE